MESPEDLFYLKHFVKQHPDNKMGWYLLGKQYLLAGKEGKANYCFLQAGEVYDAFEDESHPLSENQLQLLKDWDERQRKKRLARRSAAIGMLLLLVAVLLPVNGTIHEEEAAVKPVPVAPAEAAPVGVVFVPRKELRPVGQAWNSIAAAGTQAPSYTIAARLEEEAGWRKWTGNTKLLMTVEREAAAGKLEASMLDRDACLCEPSDGTRAAGQFASWSERQEAHWTVASAIHHYERTYKKWPERLDDLIRPYPHNVLAGERDGMKEMFPGILAKLKEDRSQRSGARDGAAESLAGGVGSAAAGGRVGTNGMLDENWASPLEIVVDKATHRLAVVQGDIIVRSYKVGLGGDETPEGIFDISEKVRNPNGRSDGLFGSRGMTLSGTLYAIHGTDEPESIGKDESLGCVRMGKEDVEELFDLVPLGTVVKIKNGTLPSDSRQPAKRFKLEPRQNETNPAKVYEWLT
ncbi:L,D-transpeptidase [Paenibacillus arenilitoris]|uniref:L,D-transpeptidase n=1 Tax=Paenibacillus arenilitoris TaxID=2772299 RepID=A0A927H8J6_9BACL|nr:L,D-transpeptidase [Paenibacillus arenilitoris]MBD2872806.1 L,D-transpeptidase [Paenibacillus arenilitoris]